MAVIYNETLTQVRIRTRLQNNMEYDHDNDLMYILPDKFNSIDQHNFKYFLIYILLLILVLVYMSRKFDIC